MYHFCPPTVRDFRAELEERFAAATRDGSPYIDICSGDLHKSIGWYPGPDHRMPTCCRVMRDMMRLGDTVLEEPPKGAGANVVIRYRLPRSAV
jgi:5-methylcytosine-specific restriction protein A